MGIERDIELNSMCIPHRGKVDRESLWASRSAITSTSVSQDPYLRHSETKEIYIILMAILFMLPSSFQIDTSRQSLMHGMAAASAAALTKGHGVVCFCAPSGIQSDENCVVS